MTARPVGSIAPAVATICFDGFGDEDFAPSFAGIPELGITNVEFNCWYPRNLTPAGLDSIRRRCDGIGAQPISLQILSPEAGEGFGVPGAEVARWLGLLDAADRLGVRIIKTTGSHRDDGTQLARFVETMKHIVPVAEERGVTIAVENHFQNTFEFSADYSRIFEEIDSAAIGMCLDTGHFAASGVDMLGLIDEFGDRVVHIDLKDCAREGEADFVAFGRGVVDFDAVLTKAASAGYTGYLVVEYPLADTESMMTDLRAGAAIAARHTAA